MEPIVSLIKKVLNQTFDIREGEYRRVLLMQLNIFLIIFVLLIIKPVVNAQFLTVVGVDRLPVIFLIVSLCALLVSTLYSRSLDKYSMRSVTTVTLGLSVFMLISIGLLLNFKVAEEFLLYALFVGVALFGVLTTSQFWILANMAFDSREAKRLFGFIGAGPIAGGVAGGYVTSILAPHLSAGTLLILAAMLLSFCIPLNAFIWRHSIKTLSPFQKKKRIRGFGEHPLQLIRKSKHLTYLALLVGLGVIVTKLVDFQFSSVATQAYPDPEELTSFLAFWFSTFNVVSLLIQLFLTRRIVGTYGVGASLFTLPGGVLAGSVVLLFTPILWAGVLTKLWEVSVKQSVNKAATELLSLPIPSTIKSQTKSFIDVFVDMTATGIGGILLIVLVNGFDLSVRAVSVLTIIILAIWFWVAINIRKEYINSFKRKLSQADKQKIKPAPDLNNVSVLNGLKKALQTGTENQIVYVLKKVTEIQDDRLFGEVHKFLTHDSPKVKIQALECIYFLNKTVDTDQLNGLMTDPNLEVRYKAFSQLLHQTKVDRISLINRYLLDENPLISSAALLGLSEESRNNPEMKRMLKLEQHINDKLDYAAIAENINEGILYKKIAIRAAGLANINSFYPLIQSGLEDENIEIINEAIQAAGNTMNGTFLLPLVSKLTLKKTRSQAQSALKNFGPAIIPELKAIALDPNTKAEISTQIPGVLGRIDLQIAVDTLHHFLDIEDVNLRLEALRALNIIQRDFPHRNIRKDRIIDRIIDETKLYKEILATLYLQNQKVKEEEDSMIHDARKNLINHLENRIDGTLERMFRLLGLRYPPDDVIPAYEGILSVNPSVRLNSVEFLDNLLEPALKKALLPIAESAILERYSSEVVENLNLKVKDELKCLEALLKGRDPRLKLSVLDLIEAIDEADYYNIITPLLDSPVTKIRNRVKLILG